MLSVKCKAEQKEGWTWYDDSVKVSTKPSLALFTFNLGAETSVGESLICLVVQLRGGILTFDLATDINLSQAGFESGVTVN